MTDTHGDTDATGIGAPASDEPAGAGSDDLRSALLRHALRPLVEAGWLLEGPWTEESWEFGDSVSFDLRRGDRHLQAELYEDDALALWVVHPEGEGCVDDPDVHWSHGPEDVNRLRNWYEELSLLR